ncbi:MAG: prolipoprotein diacylglyceryl transferase family protein [Roseiflexaceae bacterium]|jgi:prolipoprotein diacylglyceryltransferase
MMPLITVGPLRLSSYGLLLISALMLWWGWSERRIRVATQREPDVLLGLLILGAWLGARLWYVAGSSAIGAQLLHLRALEFAWPGALVGALAMLVVAQWRWQWSVTQIISLIAVPSLLAQAIGALGMYIAGIGLGQPWDGVFAVEMAGALRHPVQLYEASIALCGALMTHRLQQHHPQLTVQLFVGALAVNWLIVEGFRAQSVVLPGGIHVAQVIGLVLCVGVVEHYLRASSTMQRSAT